MQSKSSGRRRAPVEPRRLPWTEEGDEVDLMEAGGEPATTKAVPIWQKLLVRKRMEAEAEEHGTTAKIVMTTEDPWKEDEAEEDEDEEERWLERRFGRRRRTKGPDSPGQTKQWANSPIGFWKSFQPGKWWWPKSQFQALWYLFLGFNPSITSLILDER